MMQSTSASTLTFGGLHEANGRGRRTNYDFQKTHCRISNGTSTGLHFGFKYGGLNTDVCVCGVRGSLIGSQPRRDEVSSDGE